MVFSRRSTAAGRPGAAAGLLAGLLLVAPLQGQDAGGEGDLRDPFRTGWMLEDRSGDGVIDALNVRIVVPDDATHSESVAAANLAARLGYETSATALGLIAPEGTLGAVSTPVILIGDRVGLLATAGVDLDDLRIQMAPGEGIIVHLPISGTLPMGGMALIGYDATGLLEVAAWAAGRLPEIWTLDGDDWSEVAEAVAAFVQAPADGSLAEDQITLDRIVVDAGRPGVARARVTVPAGSEEAAAGWVAALRGVEADSADAASATPADSPVPDSAAAEEEAPALSTLQFRHLHRLDVRVVGPATERTVAVRPDEPWETGAGAAWRAGTDASFALPQMYEVGGLFRDTNRDLVPDEIAAYLSVGPGASAPAVGDLATRIGLEAAGLRAPLAVVARQTEAPEELGFPVVIGSEHYQLNRLLEAEKLPGWAPATGAGSVRFVEGAFNGRNGMVVAGPDAAGTDAALGWLSGRAPYLWEHGKGRYRLADAETDARRVLQGRTAPGQAALGLHKLDRWMQRLAEHGAMAGAPLPDRVGDSTSMAAFQGQAGAAPAASAAQSQTAPLPPTRIEVELAVESADEGLEAVAVETVRGHFPDAEIEVATFSTGFGVGDTIYDRTLDFTWEVDDARARLETQLYPNVARGGDATVHLRVSEPPEIRAELEAEIRSELAARGVATMEVTVLSAYKQGYSWLTDDILPRLQQMDFGSGVSSIQIDYHTLEDSDEVRWQTIAANTRWLQELYPVDAVLARDLGIDVDAITFNPVRSPDSIYRVRVMGEQGELLMEESFQPRYVVRPFFDLFPEYEQIRVTTGWLTATVGNQTLIDERIVTDPERFWDELQTEVYGTVIDYVMDIQDGSPSAGNAPYFDEFRIDLRMSEPNHRIGIGEELISSLEALHEDIYFETLTLFDLIGDRYGVGGLSYPGRILPYIDPSGDGQPGSARVTLTGKERGAPELIVRAHAADGTVEFRDYGLGSIALDAPALVGITVADRDRGAVPIDELLLSVEVSDSIDRYDEFRGRTSEAGIDRSFLSVPFMEGVLGQLGRLHQAGLYGDALSWDVVGQTTVMFTVEDDSIFNRRVTLPRSNSPRVTVQPTLMAEGYQYRGESMVQWDTPIPPAENDSILARMNTFPGVDVWYVTDSYLGQPVWVADFLPEDAGLERGYVSQAKLNALKPTLFISGRQHANEVSSTSHILRLAELLVTDSTHRAMLDRVNVVLHPITNPDGARLAVEMQETNPDFMLHAGYLGSLGVDATSGERSDDPIYPESQARRRVRESWLPDAYVNMHGYPSHEWVQYFAGYSAWVRSRRGGQRDWWSPRGWFIPGFGWVEDEDNPDYTTAQFAMLDSVAASIRAEPDVAAMSDEMYARYRKYGVQDRDEFREYFRNGILVYLSLNPSSSIGNGAFSTRTTYFSTTTEAPDETARGDWLDLVSTAGLAHSTALLRYLANGEFEVEREADAFDGVVTRKVFRVRPVLPRTTGDGGDEDPPGN